MQSIHGVQPLAGEAFTWKPEMVMEKKFAVLPHAAILRFAAQRSSNVAGNAAGELKQQRSSHPIRKASRVCTRP
jgi:hypothetical protein